MKPDKPGVWEWYDDHGVKRLVEVYDINASHRNIFGGAWLRVYFWGGYYNVNDEHDLSNPEYDIYTKAEWADRWGKRVADNNTLPEEQLYLIPNAEELAIIRRQDAMQAMRIADRQGELE